MGGLLLREHDFVARTLDPSVLEWVRLGIIDRSIENGGHAGVFRPFKVMTVQRVTVHVWPVAVCQLEPLFIVFVIGTPKQVAADAAQRAGDRALLDWRIFGGVCPPVNPIFLVIAISVARGGA